LPIDLRLTAAPAPGGIPLAAHLATLAGAAGGAAHIVVAFQDAGTAGLDSYLGGPAAGVLAARQATGKAGEVTPVAIWLGGGAHRLTFLGLGALYATDDGLAGALLAAGADAGEPVWRMPLADDYGDALESPVAHLANVRHSSRPRAGSIEAALFLREFTGGRPWAHLDIAGAARFVPDGDEAKGATGFGTRLLLRWLCGLGDAAPVTAGPRPAGRRPPAAAAAPAALPAGPPRLPP
jgi:hypothetical protein